MKITAGDLYRSMSEEGVLDFSFYFETDALVRIPYWMRLIKH